MMTRLKQPPLRLPLDTLRPFPIVNHLTISDSHFFVENLRRTRQDKVTFSYREG